MKINKSTQKLLDGLELLEDCFCWYFFLSMFFVFLGCIIVSNPSFYVLAIPFITGMFAIICYAAISHLRINFLTDGLLDGCI
jgi:hypothetical protein